MNALRQLGLTLVSIGAIAVLGCDRKTAPATTPPIVTGLTVVQVEQQKVPNTSTAIGTLHAKESSVLSAQTTGRVVSVAVREGDMVHAGQTLLTLDTAQAQYDVARAKAASASSDQAVKVAETQAGLSASTLKRYEILRDHKAVSPQEFDEVSRKAQAAQAQLDAARAQTLAARADANGVGAVAAYGRLVAPFNGLITARHVDPGAMAMPGMPLLQIEKAGTLQLTTNVDESLLQSLRTGLPIDVQVAALGSSLLTGHVSDVNQAGDPGSHSFEVKIDLPSVKGLRSGMFGTAAIGTGAHVVLLAPKAAIVTHGSLNAVWVIDTNHVASLRYVTLGSSLGDRVVVLSGLSAGETVVISPEDRQLGGSRIEVRP